MVNSIPTDEEGSPIVARVIADHVEIDALRAEFSDAV
jgi:hypothetical protein